MSALWGGGRALTARVEVVERVSLLIEDHGRIRVVDLSEREEGRETRLSEIDGAIRTLGFVGINAGGGAATVRLCPESVAPVAFVTMMQWLIDAPINRFALSYYEDGAWQNQIFPLTKASLHRVAGLVRRAKEGIARSDTRMRSISAALVPPGPLRRALEHWRAVSGFWDEEALSPFLRAALADRYALYECRSDHEFVFVDVGGGMPACALNALRASLGCRVDQLPDSAYGQSCAEAYERSVAQGTPGLQDVDAMVWWPQHGRLRRRYKRLLLPFYDAANQRLLLSVTAEDRTIDLRSAAA